jgi:uncharacterized protein (DUF924 family)
MSTSPSGTASFDASDPEGWRSVLAFWFPPGLAEADLETHRTMHAWWLRGGATAELPPFAPVLEAAGRGALDHWAATPPGRLALIIVLDQFSRNVYRGSPLSYAQDEKALGLALEGIDARMDQELTFAEQLFFWMPLGHSEDLAINERAVRHQEEAMADPPAHLRAEYEFGIGQARGAHDVISRFGRYPHRNEILGRDSTPEELEYLRTETPVHMRCPPS